MATFVFISGAGSGAWDWHLVEPELRRLGHDVVTTDPPADPAAGLDDYASLVIDNIGNRGELIVVAQSFGGYIGTIVCSRIKTDRLILLAAMVPRPGERPGEFWSATGHAALGVDFSDEQALFFHDVDATLAAASADHVAPFGDGLTAAPWPLEAWPDVPTRFLLCTEDRLFPEAWMRGVVADRLPGVEIDTFESGHVPSLAKPVELAARLHGYST